MLLLIHYIYFVFGLAFFLFGFTILHYPTENSVFKFSRALKYLGLFGISHGLYQWVLLFTMLEGDMPKTFLAEAGFALMLFSYLMLLFFTVTVIWGRKRRLKIVGLFVLVWLAVLLLFGGFSFVNMDILTRYLLGAPGIFLSAYIFFHPNCIVRSSSYQPVKRYLYSLGLIFLLYGILAGVIVSPGDFFPASHLNTETFENFSGLPVQLFSVFCAIGAIFSISKILQQFKHETDMQLFKLSLALQESGDTVVITDIQGQIEYVNRAFENQTGFATHEAIGQNPKILHSGEHSQSFYEHLWQTILGGNTYRGIIVNKTKEGALYHEFKTIVPLRNKKNEISNFISTGKDITARISLEDRLKKAASTDHLTGAANRSQFNQWLKSAIERAKDSDYSISLIMFDIDNFKHVNDTFGHNAGDEVLVTISQIVRSVVRSSDMFTRWGGEEFLILQVETDFEDTVSLAERIRHKVKEASFKDVGRVTISLGVAKYQNQESIESLVKKADDAMYRAKEEGKNTVVVDGRY
jgi:diguanylate cyclase (GGDEF)-like protein/PAS domain S-box-containing protein